MNVYALPESEKNKLRQPPTSLVEALNHLKADRAFLLEGEIFSEELLDVYVQMKLEKEVGPLAERPHPYEYQLYYDL